MRKFLINVNGNSYEVEVEEIGTATSPSAGAFCASAKTCCCAKACST